MRRWAGTPSFRVFFISWEKTWFKIKNRIRILRFLDRIGAELLVFLDPAPNKIIEMIYVIKYFKYILFNHQILRWVKFNHMGFIFTEVVKNFYNINPLTGMSIFWIINEKYNMHNKDLI